MEIDVSFREGYITLANLEKRLKFIKGLPIFEGSINKIETIFGPDGSIFIYPEEEVLAYRNLTKIEDCEVSAFQNWVDVFENKTRTHYNFCYSNRELTNKKLNNPVKK